MGIIKRSQNCYLKSSSSYLGTKMSVDAELLCLLSELVVCDERTKVYDSASDEDEEFRHCNSHAFGYGTTVYQLINAMK